MKFTNFIKTAFISLILIALITTTSSLKTSSESSGLTGDYKLLFINNLSSVSNDPNNHLITPSYKNVKLGERELTVFTSTDPSSPVTFF